MQNKRKPFILSIILCIFYMIISIIPVYAEEYTSSDGNIIIIDTCDLLTPEEEEKLVADMRPITEYGRVMFATGSTSDGAATSQELFHSVFYEGESAVLFYIDIGSRRLQIYSDGQIYNKISTSKANEITNSVYREAKSEKWYECASKAFHSILDCLDGKTVLRPMRYFQSFFLALAFASIIIYLWLYSSRKSLIISSDTDKKRDSYIKSISRISYTNINKKLERTVHHSSSSSGGGGGGGGGGHSGGGGGSGF